MPVNLHRVLRPSAVVLGSFLAAGLASPGGGGGASAAVLYSDNFDAGALNGTPGSATGGTFAIQGTVTEQSPGDFAVFVNNQAPRSAASSASDSQPAAGPPRPCRRSRWTWKAAFAANTNINMRVDNQTSNNIGSSTQAIVGSNQVQSALITADSTADRTLYFLFNVGTVDQEYTNPIDNSTVVLQAGSLDYYVRDNVAGTYTQLVTNKAVDDRNAEVEGYGELIRYAFGNGGNADTATYQLDNLLLESGINAAFVPEPSALAVLGLGSLLALRRRRSA